MKQKKASWAGGGQHRRGQANQSGERVPKLWSHDSPGLPPTKSQESETPKAMPPKMTLRVGQVLRWSFRNVGPNRIGNLNE